MTEAKKRPIRALIVEDSEDDEKLLLLELRQQGYAPSWARVDTAPAMSDALDRERWDVIFADYNLPSFSAPAALELLRGKGLDLPFFVISGTVGEELAVEMMKATHPSTTSSRVRW